MFDDISYTEDPVNAFEERRLLRQIISTGVGYPFDRPYCSKAAIESQLENEDRLWAEEYNLLFGDIDFKRKKKQED